MSKSKNLSDVDAEEFRQFFNSFDTVLCDCDGVLIFLATAIENTPEVLAKLKERGKRVHYVTNNCTLPRTAHTQLLNFAGFDVKVEEVIMPTSAIIDYLKSIDFKKKLFVLSFGGLKYELENAGFKLADTGPSEVEESVKGVTAIFSDLDPDVGAVIVDTDMNVNYARLQKAILYLQDPGVHFIAASQDGVVAVGPNIHLIGPQHFNNIIKTFSGRDPIGFGKPSQKLIDFVNSKFNVNPNRTLFVGDAFHDMTFADQAGYQKLLVLTGAVTKEQFENCTDPKMLPNYYLNSLGDMNMLVDQLTKSVKSSL